VSFLATLTDNSVAEERCTAVEVRIRCSPAVVVDNLRLLDGCNPDLDSMTWPKTSYMVPEYRIKLGA